MEIKQILVTGSSGYIGSVLVPKLLEQRYKVIGIDSLFFKTKSKFKHVNYTFINKDIRKIEKKDLIEIDAIIHLAALSNDSLGEIKKELTQQINYKATVRLARLAKKMNVKRFIFASSCSVYGIAKNGIVYEKSKPNPLTNYANSKILSEKALKKLADANFTVVLLRNATVYGYSPNFRDDLVVNNLVGCGIALSQIRIKSDGSPWRPLIDVRDLSDILIKFLTLSAKKINGQIINVGFNKNNFQIKTILKIIHNYLPDCKIIYTGEHTNDSRSYRVNFDKFKKISPTFRPKWNLEKSIADLIVNLREIKYSKKDFLSGRYTRLKTINNLVKKNKLSNDLFFSTK